MSAFTFPALLLLWLFVAAWPAAAQTPSFQMPVDCRLGENCWIVNYVDVDDSADVADFRCGHRSYDDHHGTDFGLADMVIMEQGVAVTAAAAGTVQRIRDEMPDRLVSPEEKETLLAENRGCGNGVFIDHGGGWQTIYCHLKQGSIAVKPGDEVKAGDALGMIGASGIAEFPHVHFGVFFEGTTIDPFTGRDPAAGCGADGTALWHGNAGLTYQGGALYAAGFSARPPDFEAVRIDTASPDTLDSAAAEALVFWAAFYGTAKGDEARLEIRDPQGRLYAERTITQDRDRARQFYYIGRRISADKPLVPGPYTGYVRLRQTLPGGATSESTAERTITVR